MLSLRTTGVRLGATACARGRLCGSLVTKRLYHNRNPAAFMGTQHDDSRDYKETVKVFKHYGILFGKSNRKMTAKLYYYHTEYKGSQYPKVIEPRVLCEANSDEPHFMASLYSTHNRSACFHIGRLIAKRAHECGVLQYTTMLKYSLGRPLGVHNLKQMLLTMSVDTSPRMRAFVDGYREERMHLLKNSRSRGLKMALDGDGADDDFLWWPSVDGKPLGTMAEKKKNESDDEQA